MKEKCKRFFTVPKRVVIAICSFLALCNIYIIQKFIALTEHHIIEVLKENKRNTSILCPHLAKNNTQEYPWPRYEWPENEVTNIHECYYYGYIITEFVGGYLSDKFGAKYVVQVPLVLSTILTFLGPVYVKLTKITVTASKIVFFSFGFGQGSVIVAVTSLMSHWTPKTERARLGSLTFSGIMFGVFVSRITYIKITERFKDWEIAVYILASIELLTCVFWQFCVFSSPDQHPRITLKEKEYLDAEMEDTVDHGRKKIPFRQIFTSKAVWAVNTALLGQLMGASLRHRFMDDYQENVLMSDDSRNLLTQALPALVAMVFILINGFFMDWVNNKNYMNIVSLRKVFVNIALMGPQIFLLAASYANCQKNAVQLLFVFSYLSNVGFVAIRLMHMDLSPNFAGTLATMGGVLGTLGSIIGGRIMEKLIIENTFQEYRNVLWVSFGVAVVTNFIFALFGYSNMQEWNNPNADSGKNKKQ